MAHAIPTPAGALPPAFLIDTDPGIDDAQALFMFLKAAELGHIDVVAITATCGNLPLSTTLNNVCATLEGFGGAVASRIPVYAGADRPLVSAPEHCSLYHGADGLGNTGFGSRADLSRVVRDEHASLAILRIARDLGASGRPLTLVALGPLTNLALALRLAGSGVLARRVKDLVVMGGAYQARGNTTMTAEFNIYADPEAAAVVFAEPWTRVRLATWELTQASGLREPFLSARWLHGNTARSAWLRDVSAHLVDFGKKSPVWEREGFHIPDPVAAFIALCPGGIKRSATRGIAVELAGRHTRGQTLVDWGGRDTAGCPPVVEIVQEIDMEALHALLEESVA